LHAALQFADTLDGNLHVNPHGLAALCQQWRPMPWCERRDSIR
jgi:hypothetical protein